MTKKITLTLAILALGIAVFSMIRSYSTSELVYVDVNKLLEGYKRTEVVRGDLKKQSDQMKANVDSLITGWQKELKTYEKQRSEMSKKEKELQQELLANKQQQINSYQQAIGKQIQKDDAKATQTVINDINDYVKEYGKKHNHQIIFGAGGNGNIMYAEEVTDLTETVLKGLNAEFQGK